MSHVNSHMIYPQEDLSGPSKRRAFLPPKYPRSYSFQHDANNNATHSIYSNQNQQTNIFQFPDCDSTAQRRNTGPCYRLAAMNSQQNRSQSLNNFYNRPAPISPGLIGVFSSKAWGTSLLPVEQKKKRAGLCGNTINNRLIFIILILVCVGLVSIFVSSCLIGNEKSLVGQGRASFLAEDMLNNVVKENESQNGFDFHNSQCKDMWCQKYEENPTKREEIKVIWSVDEDSEAIVESVMY